MTSPIQSEVKCMIQKVWLRLLIFLMFCVAFVAAAPTLVATSAYDVQCPPSIAHEIYARDAAYGFDGIEMQPAGESRVNLSGPNALLAAFSEFLAAEESAGVVGEAAQTGGRAPNFIVSEGGTAYPVPEGATGPFPAESGKGFQFTGGSGGNGLSPSATDFRFMDPVTTGKYQYPGGYGSYGNAAGQTINPLTGQTIAPSNPWWHISGQ